MMKKQRISLLLTAVMVFSLCACGQEVQETAGKNIALVEPVNVTASTEKAACRNIYNYQAYPASVYPETTELSFSETMEITGSAAYWGESVEKGSVLIYGNTEKMDEEIEKMEEQIADKEEAMKEAEETLNEELAKPREEEKFYLNGVEAYEKIKPAEQIKNEESETGEMIANPEYAEWKKEADVWTGKYRILAHNIDMKEEAFRQQKELYDLEHEYLLERLQDMKETRKSSVLSSKVSGTVVAEIMDTYGGHSVRAEEPIVAIGDLDKKVLKTDYINKTKIANAKDVYAFVDGIRYEVEYHPMDKDEYTKITSDGSKAYSTFSILGDTAQIKVGDFAMVCVFSEKKENVLSVPKEALHKDGSGSFVYVMKDGQSVATPVKTGITDGVYTEIISGIAEGDDIMVETARSFSDNTAAVSYGGFNGTFNGNGQLVYAAGEVVENSVEHGTTYFGEYLVASYQYVEKGDVIATIRVKTDDITIQRNQQKLKRAQERLEDLKKAGEEENEKAIKAKQEEIDDIKELLAKIDKDGKTTEIKAPRSGMIMEIEEYEKETILYNGSHIADIANADTGYIYVENPNQVLNYGNEVDISYIDYNGKKGSCKGMVANVAEAGVSKELRADYSMIKVPKEALSDLAVARNNPNEWWDPNRYTITATIREMENVLVVPRKAVMEIDGCTYVNVKDEQGNMKMCSFVPGGYDETNYWIIEGLSEGMVICLK